MSANNKSLLISILFIFVCTVASGKTKLPRIVVDKTEYDLGIIDRNATSPVRTFNIKVENKGKAPLVINEVITDCEHCTHVEVADSTIARKASTDLVVTFNSKDFFVGPIEKSIYIRTNDAASPEIEVHFKAELR